MKNVVSSIAEKWLNRISIGINKVYGEEAGKKWIDISVDGVFDFVDELNSRGLSVYNPSFAPIVLWNDDTIKKLSDILPIPITVEEKGIITYLNLDYSIAEDRWEIGKKPLPSIYIIKDIEDLKYLIKDLVKKSEDKYEVSDTAYTIKAGVDALNIILGIWKLRTIIYGLITKAKPSDIIIKKLISKGYIKRRNV